MKSLPHHYQVEARAQSEGVIELASSGLETLQSAVPAIAGRPRPCWSARWRTASS